MKESKATKAAKLLGKLSSEKKAKAARLNGLLGGRPKKGVSNDTNMGTGSSKAKNANKKKIA